VLNLDISDIHANSILLSEDNGEKIGFLIDSVQNIIEVPASMIQSPSMEMGDFSERCTKGQFRIHDCPVVILNQGKILSMNLKINYEELEI
jgi:chemotaxis signal transduction protein